MKIGISSSDWKQHQKEYHYLSENPNITIEDVLEQRYETWDWNFLSGNPGITMSDILNNPDLSWEPEIYKNPNITLEVVEDFLNGGSKYKKLITHTYDKYCPFEYKVFSYLSQNDFTVINLELRDRYKPFIDNLINEDISSVIMKFLF